MLPYVQNFAIAFLITLLATPICKKLAFRWDLVDHPGHRKIHARTMPLLGGLALYAGFIIAVLLDGRDQQTSIILIGATLMLFLGLLDDKYSMGAKTKFMLPSMAAILLIFLGIRTVFLPEVERNLLNIGFSFLWIVGIVNAFNFIDNMDGLSTGTALVSSMLFGTLAVLSNQATVAVLSFALAGACFAFLFFNFKPAKIFAGDGGSMFLGFVLATIAIYASWETSAMTTSLLIPVLVLGYPIYDMGLVTILRTYHKKPFWIGDKNHVSHRLVKLGLSERNAVLLSYIITLCLGLTAVVIQTVTYHYAMVTAGMVFLFMIIFTIILCQVPFEWKKEYHKAIDKK